MDEATAFCNAASVVGAAEAIAIWKHSVKSVVKIHGFTVALMSDQSVVLVTEQGRADPHPAGTPTHYFIVKVVMEHLKK